MGEWAQRLSWIRRTLSEASAFAVFVGAAAVFALAYHDWLSPRSDETGVSFLFAPIAFLVVFLFHAPQPTRAGAVWSAFVVATFGAAAVRGDSLVGTAHFVAVDLLYATLLAAALRRFGTPRLALRRPYSVMLFFGLSAIAAAASGVVAATVAAGLNPAGAAIFSDDFERVFLEWAVGDAAVLLTVGAAVFAAIRGNLRNALEHVVQHRWEFAAAVGVLLAGVFYDFEVFRIFTAAAAPTSPPHPSLLFATAPAIVWLALRFTQIGAIVGVLVSTYPAVHFVNAGYGPIWLQDAGDRVLTMQAYVATVALTAFAIAALSYQIQGRERLARYALRAAKNRARDRADFMATFNHEMRTPLNAILGFTDLMRAEVNGPLAPDYKDYVVEIDHAAKRLFNLTIEVLQFNRMRRGEFELDAEPVTLEPLCADVGAGMVGMAQSRGVTLENAVAPGIVVQANEIALRQALSNLLSNAIRHTPAAGLVVVSSRFTTRGLCVDVRDTGEGFDADSVLGDMRMGRGDARAGFGLQITDTIMAVHDGALQIDSAPGRGARVSLVFPHARVVAR